MMKKQDIRVEKTLHKIRTAFLDLLDEKEFEQITVQDILNKAKINRSTFYKYYMNKNEVALALVSELKLIFGSDLEQRFTISTLEFAKLMRPVFLANQDLVRKISKIRTPKIHFLEDLREMVKMAYVKHQRHCSDFSLEELNFQGHLFGTISLTVLQYFIEHDIELFETRAVIENITEVFNLLIIKDKDE
ncbi:TetR family transcriptional regulator [Bisgaard Taxon 10/6]|uniref:TetR family transcriptional regulator n=1 Tax=Exercitatus varius TaxID=67857 RepID=A0AAW6QBX3_9PAST|nr:TetR family transcriptional regulator [Exercitatus varius]MDG2914468.1 TetR family transcriptional regulator [Exercitatus varius]MDG2918199.1 TetR family transcriptional regulator [Exercitatus varius]MDG2939122.1 TetR family transcriptional regulator [Exercitatus varius]MDG2941154.1 TetR family transcriptional regulator [Exercitatus varius]MDG2942928.1 TetR family transcriptional regulator [Exercitatus varius]